MRYSQGMPGETVLIVDDEKDFRAVIASVLERGGYRVAAAENGEEGLRQFARVKPALVLLDGHLPDIDGFEVCRRLRATPAGREVPVLLCTVRSVVESVAEGLGAGADGYLLKPFGPAELLAAVASALEARRSK